MRIGIDGKVLTLRSGGTGRYAINLTRALLKAAAAPHSGLEFVIFTGPQTSGSVLEEFRGTFDERFLGLKSSVIRSLALIPAALRRMQIDIFHGLDHVGIPLVGRTGRYVVTVHDIIPLILPQTFTLRHRMVARMALTQVRRKADLIITPSQAVKSDVVQHLGVHEDRVAVTLHGCEARFQPVADEASLRTVMAKYDLPPHYVLALGNLEPRKNLTTLLQAFARLRQSAEVDPEIQLVLAGARGWLDKPIYRTVRSLGLENVVCFPGFIEDDDLPAVYHGAAVFVFPSLYEGFGLPVIEAMACGVPVISSNTSSMPEVAGGAAMLVDPLDADQMAAAIVRVLGDEGLRDGLRQQGIARARQFSWEAAARQTLDLYASLL